MADRVVAERFRLIEPLGRGGMGTVWRAEDQVLHRVVAIKEVSLPPSLPDSERNSMRQRVLREARAAARLSHSSAVTVFDVLEEGDYTFIAMEMVDSPTMAQIVQDEGPMSPERAAFIGLKLLETLEAAHSKGIVHRDVKPANVMVSDRTVKLADFGIASVKGDPELTATGLLLGSPSYMSPEQVSGRPAGPASDLWALGATLYFAVEGKGPFDREGPLPTLLAISNEEVPEPEHAGPLAPAIESLLVKDPERRATPDQLRSMLEPIADSALLVGLSPEEPPPVEESPEDSAGGQVSFLPPEAPPDLAAFMARHDAEGSDAPAGPQPVRTEVERHRDELVAAMPDIETTWRQEPPEVPSLTIPVPTPQAGQDAAASAEPAHPNSGGERIGAGDRNWAVVGGVIALALLAFLLVPRLFSSPSDEPPAVDNPNQAQAPPAAGAAPAPEAPEPQQPAPVREDTGEREASGSQSQTETAGSGDVPSGWRSVAVGDTGYGISYPPSWSVRNNPLGDGSSMRINGPQSKYLLVDWTNDPGDDALAAWEQLSASFSQRHENYREIRLERSTFRDFPTAATWEWTYTERGAQLHAINLGFAGDDYGFALNFQTRAGDWESSRNEFEAFKASFGER